MISEVTHQIVVLISEKQYLHCPAGFSRMPPSFKDSSQPIPSLLPVLGPTAFGILSLPGGRTNAFRRANAGKTSSDSLQFFHKSTGSGGLSPGLHTRVFAAHELIQRPHLLSILREWCTAPRRALSTKNELNIPFICVQGFRNIFGTEVLKYVLRCVKCCTESDTEIGDHPETVQHSAPDVWHRGVTWHI